MEELESTSVGLVLRKKPIVELRDLAQEFEVTDTDSIRVTDKQNLIILLTDKSREDGVLEQRLLSEAISFRPSFYLMTTSPTSKQLLVEQIISDIEASVESLNNFLRSQTTPTYREFKLAEVVELEPRVFRVQFEWQRIYWYWEPESCKPAFIYELQVGFFVVDVDRAKAICTCHSEKEREYLCKPVRHAFEIELKPLVLTKPLLDQIGDWNQVRRASYSTRNSEELPQNATYADEHLYAFDVVQSREEDVNSVRTASFYQIPLGTVVETGVGVTSSSGKLWIPRETSLDVVSEYCVLLVRKIRTTLDKLSSEQNHKDVLETFGLDSKSAFLGVSPKKLKGEFARLLFALVNMILASETERHFATEDVLVEKGVKAGYFNKPRLLVEDEDTGDFAYWKSPYQDNQFVRFESSTTHTTLYDASDDSEIDITNIPHPITGSKVSIDNPLNFLELLPTPKLERLLLKEIEYLSGQYRELQRIEQLPFYIAQGIIHLNLNRCKNYQRSTGTRKYLRDFANFSDAQSNTVASTSRDELTSRLWFLGEQCKQMSDDNCRSCTEDQDYLCLRSLVGSFLEDSEIYRHKGIELSDIQGNVTTLDGEQLRVFGFAKLASGKNVGLTARNNNGAILLGQVLGQIDKTQVDMVTIISPSTINEDLVERLELICDMWSKYLLILDSRELSRILIDFEEQYSFDKDLTKLYKRSKPKTKLPIMP